MIVSGPVWSGKTSFVVRLIDSCEQIFDVVPERVYWIYGTKTDDHEMLTKKTYVMIDGLPDDFDFCEPNSIVVLDDLMMEAKAHEGVTALYTKIAHHRPLFVITMLQNFYIQSMEMRNRHLNLVALFKKVAVFSWGRSKR
jgi:nicotinamide riboside kinase